MRQASPKTKVAGSGAEGVRSKTLSRALSLPLEREWSRRCEEQARLSAELSLPLEREWQLGMEGRLAEPPPLVRDREYSCVCVLDD